MAFGSVMTLAGCSTNAEHEHKWDEGIITTLPTCIEDGVKTYTCECGETKTDKVDAYGHDYGMVIDQNKSTIDYICGVCEDIEKSVPYYTTDKARDYMLSDAWASLDEMTVLGFVKGTPSYNETYGSYTIDLYVGNDVFKFYSVVPAEDAIDFIAVNGIQEGDLLICTGPSKIYGGTTFELAYDSGLGINPTIWYAERPTWDEGVVTKAPTCEEAGIKTFATAEGAWSRTEVVSATGHKWDEGAITTEPTTEAEGVKTYHCEKCDATKTEAVAKLPPVIDNNDDGDKDDGEVGEVTTTVLSYASGTTTSVKEGGDLGSYINTDANLTLAVTNPDDGYNNGVGLNKDGTIRLYSQGKGSGNGTKITISLPEGKTFTNVTLSLSNLGKGALLSINGAEGVEVAAATLSVDFTEATNVITLHNVTPTKSVQIWMTYISVSYK